MTATLKARFLAASAYARPVIPLTLSLIAGIAIGLLALITFANVVVR